MAPRLVLALLAVAFGVAVVGATITTIQQVRFTAPAHSAAYSRPALTRRLDAAPLVPAYEYQTRRS
jgi:hypothetical protein